MYDVALPDRSAVSNVSHLIPVLQRYARHLSDSVDQAEDLAQETVLRALDRLDRGDEITLLRPYLFAIMRNLHRQGLRQRVDTCALDENTLTGEGGAFRAIACQEVRRAIGQLSPEQARLVLLVMQGETSPARLAALTGLPSGTVMSRLRARAQLRDRMGLAAGTSVVTLFDETTRPS